MDLAKTLRPKAPPIRIWDDGAVRLGDTRVSLDTVVYAFNQGQPPEAIVHSYPSLRLADVYAAIAYYLDNRETVDKWIEEQDRVAEEFRREWEREHPSRVIKENLLSRLADRNTPQRVKA